MASGRDLVQCCVPMVNVGVTRTGLCCTRGEVEYGISKVSVSRDGGGEGIRAEVGVGRERDGD